MYLRGNILNGNSGNSVHAIATKNKSLNRIHHHSRGGVGNSIIHNASTSRKCSVLKDGYVFLDKYPCNISQTIAAKYTFYRITQRSIVSVGYSIIDQTAAASDYSSLGYRFYNPYIDYVINAVATCSTKNGICQHCRRCVSVAIVNNTAATCHVSYIRYCN